MLYGGDNSKDENENFYDFTYVVREIISRILNTKLSKVRKVIYNNDDKGNLLFNIRTRQDYK